LFLPNFDFLFRLLIMNCGEVS